MKFADVYTTVLTSYPDVMSTEETALALGVSTKTVYRLLRDNKISHIELNDIPLTLDQVLCLRDPDIPLA